MGNGPQSGHPTGQSVSDVARALRGNGHRERRQLVNGAQPFHIQVVFDSSFDGIPNDDPRRTAFSDAAVRFCFSTPFVHSAKLLRRRCTISPCMCLDNEYSESIRLLCRQRFGQ